MSTFKGVVAEFPQIRIDYFRTIQYHTPPLACFLSHVHSDHLQGLESLKSPFVYCSAATRELLLRLEKYPHRMNFAKGVLESRKQHYRHLANLLKPIPLNVPTVIELSPGSDLRVTLFDANHCAGAVMFLIQGQGKAILYTGDIRSEAWWVNALVRQPVLVPYTIGKLRLDNIYLDTTFAVNADPYRKFASKAEGLRELLEKVMLYPGDTIFHFNAWTLGYEDVWIALAAMLGSQVHVDRYKMRLYKSIASVSGNSVSCHEGPPLCGFKFGNRHQPGCLTTDQATRLHSCERGTVCLVFESSNVVTITPIISRLSTGAELLEIGAGGGGGDLSQIHELELNDAGAVGMLMKLCKDKVQDPASFAKICSLISTAMVSDRQMLSLDALALGDGTEAIRLPDLADMLIEVVQAEENHRTGQEKTSPLVRFLQPKPHGHSPSRLPPVITFPYSRHSSYEELCLLVNAFKPRDVYPCTTDEENWHQGLSMKALFGHLCSGEDFAYDQGMEMARDERMLARRKKRRGVVHPDDQRVSSSQCSSRTDRSGEYSDNDSDGSLAEAAIATIATVIRSGEGLGDALPKYPAKRSRTHHQGATFGKPDSQRGRIDAVAKGFGEDTANTRHSIRPKEADNVQSRGSLSFEKFSVRNSSAGGKIQNDRAVKPQEVQKKVLEEIIDSKKQSATEPVPAASIPNTTSSVSSKTFICHWLDCIERFITIDSLARHVSERHCVEIPISEVSLFGCLWGECVRQYPSKELWTSHMFGHHIYRESGRILPRSSDTSESRGSPLLSTPPGEHCPRSADLHVRELSQQQPTSTTSRPWMDDTLVEEADQTGEESPCSESLLFGSQSSSIFSDERAKERLQDRKKAYAATSGASGAGWFALNLISTGAGHTEQEVEL